MVKTALGSTQDATVAFQVSGADAPPPPPISRMTELSAEQRRGIPLPDDSGPPPPEEILAPPPIEEGEFDPPTGPASLHVNAILASDVKVLVKAAGTEHDRLKTFAEELLRAATMRALWLKGMPGKCIINGPECKHRTKRKREEEEEEEEEEKEREYYKCECGRFVICEGCKPECRYDSDGEEEDETEALERVTWPYGVLCCSGCTNLVCDRCVYAQCDGDSRCHIDGRPRRLCSCGEDPGDDPPGFLEHPTCELDRPGHWHCSPCVGDSGW